MLFLCYLYLEFTLRYNFLIFVFLALSFSPILAHYGRVPFSILGKQENFTNNLNDKVNHASMHLCEGLRAQKQAS